MRRILGRQIDQGRGLITRWRRLLSRGRLAIDTGRVQRERPGDIAPAVHAMDAMGLFFGRGDETMLARMQASDLGRQLLEERHDILALISDRDRLRILPEGSLGREYCRFAEDNQLFPEQLAAVVRQARVESGGFVPESTPEAAYLHDRYRDLHDLWHVLTGYGTDMGGEWGIIAFQTRQVGYRSMAVMAGLNMLKNAIPGRLDLVGTWWRGRRRGAAAQYLLAQDWEGLLPQPLEEVRRNLGIDPLPKYRPWNYPEAPKVTVSEAA
jgi:ubiquinone biosynthesis protein COQ4